MNEKSDDFDTQMMDKINEDKFGLLSIEFVDFCKMCEDLIKEVIQDKE